MTPSARGGAIDNLLERLRARQWRLTPQRRVVAEVLSGENVHLTAETVHERSRALLPEISLAPVYNTLNEMVAMGEVLELAPGAGPKRYDPNAHLAHHHLACTSCGALRDVPAGADVPVPADLEGFVVTGESVVFRGLCPTCAAATSPPAADADDGQVALSLR